MNSGSRNQGQAQIAGGSISHERANRRRLRQGSGRHLATPSEDAPDRREDVSYTYDCFFCTPKGYTQQWFDYGSRLGPIQAANFGVSAFSPDRQARLEIIIPQENVEPEDVERQFDVDSARGLVCEGEEWPFTGQLQVYLIPPPTESISEGSRYYLTVNGEKVSRIL